MSAGERLADALDALERRLRRARGALGRPPVAAAVLVLLVLASVAVRLPVALGSEEVFEGHADARTYFNAGYARFLGGHFYPLAHGGSGWPLLLAVVFDSLGFAPGAAVPQGETAPFDAVQAEALQVAHATTALIGAGLSVATFWLARAFMPVEHSLVVAGLVAFDPFLISLSGSLMADGAFALAVVAAFACAVRAPRHPSWWAPAGALVALSHMLRVNGVVVLVALVAYAWIVLRPRPKRERLAAIGVCVVAFALVAAPYLAWRAEHLPGAFDYGTNQRFWTDDPWDTSDAYWRSYDYASGGERETAGDYFATHTLTEALTRLYRSVAWQVFDLAGGAPPDQRAPEGVALTPWLAMGALAGAFLFAREPRWGFALLLLSSTMATFVWSYPIVRSVRYFTPLVPLAALLAVVGLAFVVRRVAPLHPHAAGAALLGFWFLLYPAAQWGGVARALLDVADSPRLVLLVTVATLAWLALTLPAGRQRPMSDEREAQEAPA